MPCSCSHHTGKACCTTPARGVCDKTLVGLMLFTLVHTTEALAGEQAPLSGNAAKPDFNARPQQTALSSPMFPIPAPYRAEPFTEVKTFSTRDFRPRGHSILERDPEVGAVESAPMMSGTTVWQRLAEYRSHGRVRLVTLWETGSSSVSLQAGRRGDPSLQWTSRLMNRGGATRGLLDEVLTTSLGGVGRGLHIAPRATSTEPTGRQTKLMDVGFGAGATK
jgi:hypothetical protein